MGWFDSILHNEGNALFNAADSFGKTVNTAIDHLSFMNPTSAAITTGRDMAQSPEAFGNVFYNPVGYAMGNMLDAVPYGKPALAGVDTLIRGFAPYGGYKVSAVDGQVHQQSIGSFALDLSNRSFNTVAVTAMHAGAKSAEVGGGRAGEYVAIGQLLNTANWSKAWDMWGKAGQLSGGEVIAGRIVAQHNNTPGWETLDPFDAQDAQTLRNLAHSTVYGSLMGGFMDLAAGFVAPVPGLKVLKAARSLDKIDAGSLSELAVGLEATRAKPTLASELQPGMHAIREGNVGESRIIKKIDRLDNGKLQIHYEGTGATSIASADSTFLAGETVGKPTVGARAKNLAGAYFLGRESDPHTLYYRLQQSVQRTDGITELSDMRNFLGTWLRNASDADQAKLSDLFIESNYIRDQRLRTHAKINMMLAGMGSTAAKEELITVAPLLAKSLRERMSPLVTPQVYQDMIDAYVAGAELNINDVMKKHYDVPEWNRVRQALTSVLDVTMSRHYRALENQDHVELGKPLSMKDIADQQHLANFYQHKVDDILTGRVNEPPEASGEGGLGFYQSQARDAWDRLAEMKARYEKQTPADIHAYDQGHMAAQDLVDLRARQVDFARKDLQDAERAGQKAAEIIADPSIRADMVRSQQILNEMFSLQDGTGFVGTTAPNMLQHMQYKYRQEVGSYYLHRFGETANHPIWVRAIGKSMSLIGTPFARGAIHMADTGRAHEELGLLLKRSKVFRGEEIQAIQNEFLRTDALHRPDVVSRVHKQMLFRLGLEFHLNEAEAWSRTEMALKSYGEGWQWMSDGLAASEALMPDSKWAVMTDMEGNHHAFNRAQLKSHLADSQRFIDPAIYRRALRRHETGAKMRARRLWDGGWEAVDFASMMWKHATLMRPGLGVRAMLDTALRATAAIGAAAQLVDAINGSRRLALNVTERNLTRLGLMHDGDISQVAGRMMGYKPFEVAVAKTGSKSPLKSRYKTSTDDIEAGASSFRAYNHGHEVNATRLALSGNNTLHDGIMEASNRFYAGLRRQMDNWVHYDANSMRWTLAWRDHAANMMDSPLARELMNELEAGPRNLTREEYTKELFDRPGVRQEYRDIAAQQEHLGIGYDGTQLSPEQWVEGLMEEVRTMFPTQAARDLARSGNVTDKAVKAIFPKKARFKVPGPESHLLPDTFPQAMKHMTDRVYKGLLDNPDFWMARHPVFVRTYRSTMQDEAKALLDSLPADAELGLKDLQILESRARTKAITDVRNLFYDTNRWTGAAQVLQRIAPFFRPWEDAMMSWGKLIYDDPRRIWRIGGAWNSLDNINPWMGSNAILVDGEGNPIRQGENPASGAYIAMPFSKAITKKLFGHEIQYYVRKDSFNSIAQGNVWWAPGLGPQVAVPANIGLNYLPRDLAASLAGTDNPVATFLLKNLYLNGQTPPTDLGETFKSLVPPGWRNAFNDAFGVTGAMAQLYAINQLYMDSQKPGAPKFNPEKARAQAEKQAFAAAVVHVVSQLGLGLSGRAKVDGQFYVDQLRMIEAEPAAQLKAQGYNSPMEKFIKMFPDAADLHWGFAKNETGITASVNAQKSAAKEQKLIDRYPTLGWFIVGSDNIAQGRPGDEFSMSVYNQQLSQGYGLDGARRKRPDAGEAIGEALTAIGWKEWNKFTLGLDEYMRRSGQPESVRTLAKQRMKEALGAQYPGWLHEYETIPHTLDEFNTVAKTIATRPEMANRRDMQMYLDWSKTRQEMLDSFGIKSLNGTSIKYVLARHQLYMIGQRMAAEDFGFNQTWERMLSREVEPKEEDGQAMQDYINGNGG